jgi:hypothetical protein
VAVLNGAEKARRRKLCAQFLGISGDTSSRADLTALQTLHQAAGGGGGGCEDKRPGQSTAQ